MHNLGSFGLTMGQLLSLPMVLVGLLFVANSFWSQNGLDVHAVFKICLILILSICILWGSAIFFGPSLIMWVADRKFDGSIKVFGLEVSPDLKYMPQE